MEKLDISGTIQLRVNPEDMARLKGKAAKLRINHSSLFRMILKEWLDSQDAREESNQSNLAA